MSKRILPLFLSFAFLLTTVACGHPNEQVPETKPADSVSSEQITETENTFFPEVEKTDYEGADFHMIGFPAPGEWYYAEKMGAGVLSDSIFTMNQAVEEYLNVDIIYTHMPDGVGVGPSIYNKIEPSIMAGDDDYQLCMFAPFYSYYNMIHNGFATDLYTLPGIDLDQNYWNRKVIDSVAIGDSAYIGLGAFCQYRINAFYCNKKMLTDAKLEIPYKDVRNGTWTQEKLFSMTQGLYQDADGDGTKNNQDIYGCATEWDSNFASMLQGADIYVGRRNEEGRIELALDITSERLINFYDHLYAWSIDDDVFHWGYNETNSDRVVKFDEGRSYFTMNTLGTTYVHVNFEFGILPIPKYDEEQKTYNHLNWGNNLMVPSTIRNPQMVGSVLELMAYYTSTVVYEAYYNTILEYRVSDTTDDREMVELICNTVVYDPAMPFCDSCNELKNLIYIAGFGPRFMNQSITSYVKKNSRSVERFFDKLFIEE